MRDVAATGAMLVVAKNRKPVAELRLYTGGQVDSLTGLHRDLGLIGDIAALIAANDEWKAQA